MSITTREEIFEAMAKAMCVHTSWNKMKPWSRQQFLRKAKLAFYAIHPLASVHVRGDIEEIANAGDLTLEV